MDILTLGFLLKKIKEGGGGEGKTYTGVAPVEVDNSTNKISVVIDNVPTSGSNNIVKSGGVKQAIDEAVDFSAQAPILLDGKVLKATFDIAPTTGSNNFVKSGAIADAIAAKTKAYLVTTMPANPEGGAIYYVGTAPPYQINLIVTGGAIVDLGTTSIDLSIFYTKEEVDDKLDLKQDKTDSALQTTTKTITGAINELKGEMVTDVLLGSNSIVTNGKAQLNEATDAEIDDLTSDLPDADGFDVLTTRDDNATNEQLYGAKCLNNMIDSSADTRSRLVGVFSRTANFTIPTGVWIPVDFNANNNIDTKYCKANGNYIQIVKTGVYRFTVTARLADGTGILEWAIGITDHQDDTTGGAWLITQSRHKGQATFLEYYTAGKTIRPEFFLATGSKILNAMQCVVEYMGQ